LVQISPLSADNRCLPGPAFHFTIPVAVPASGFSGADQPVVSRQSMFAWASIPFHDTCSSSGQRVFWCRSARCQPTIELVRGGIFRVVKQSVKQCQSGLAD
ncbi:hypothetical protein, partial [Aeromonas hydrophila]|uniref:hypothetical protein n=1 Tax=Aeromonas hydrophila TaxID=644 RepID=UPI002B4597C3